MYIAREYCGSVARDKLVNLLSAKVENLPSRQAGVENPLDTGVNVGNFTYLFGNTVWRCFR